MQINLKNILKETHQDSKNELDYYNDIFLRDQENWNESFYNNENYFNPEQDEWQIKLINKNPFKISSIDNPSDIVIKYAIDKNKKVISVLDSNKMSFDVFLHIIGKNPEDAILISNPTKAMIKYISRNYKDGNKFINVKNSDWAWTHTTPAIIG